MVTRVYAYLNDGDEIIKFSHVEGNRWIISNIPKNVRGQYYIDIYAEDDAGNTAFISKGLFEVDPFGLCVDFKIMDKDFTSKIHDFEEHKKISDYIYRHCVKDFITSIRKSDFEFICKEVICI